MKHVNEAVVPRPSRRPRVVLPAALVAGLLALSACATPVGSAAPSPSLDASGSTAASPDPAASASPAASPTDTPTASPADPASPSANATPVTDEPFNGQILIVTSEIRDGRLEVTAMVPAVAESGGVCTLTVPATGAQVTTAATEGKDVTYCGVMSLDATGPAADMAFIVSYASAKTRAESSLTTVEPAA